MESFSATVREVAKNDTQEYVVAWCVLPNHYHLLLATSDILEFLEQEQLGKMHGRTSFNWNGEEKQRGRKVWYPVRNYGKGWDDPEL